MTTNATVGSWRHGQHGQQEQRHAYTRKERARLRPYIKQAQGELQKSKETGAELRNLTGAVNDIHDTLGGSLVSLYVIERSYLLTFQISHLMHLLVLKHYLPSIPHNLHQKPLRHQNLHSAPRHCYPRLRLPNYRPSSTIPKLRSPPTSITSKH